MSETVWLPRAEEGVTVIASSDRWDGMSPLERAAVRWLSLRDLCIEVEAGMFGAWPCQDDKLGNWCYRYHAGRFHPCPNCLKRARMRQILLWLRRRRGVALRDLRRKLEQWRREP